MMNRKIILFIFSILTVVSVSATMACFMKIRIINNDLNHTIITVRPDGSIWQETRLAGHISENYIRELHLPGATIQILIASADLKFADIRVHKRNC